MILKTTPVTNKEIIGEVTRKKYSVKNGKTYMFRTDMGEDE